MSKYKKFSVLFLVVALVLVGGFISSIPKAQAVANITITSAKITAGNEVTVIFNTGGHSLDTAPITAYGIADDGVGALTLASGGSPRNLSSVVITPNTFTAVYTFTGDPATKYDTGSLAVHAPDAILDTNTTPDSLDHSIGSIPLTDGQAPTLVGSNVLVNNIYQPNTVILTFSEPLASGPAQTVGNYLVKNTDGGIIHTIASAVLSPSNTVTLTLATVDPTDNKTFITNATIIAGVKVTPSVFITDVALNPYAGGVVVSLSSQPDTLSATVNAPLVRTNATTYKVTFSEILDLTTSQTLNNYTLSGTCPASTGNPSVAVLQANGVDVVLTIPDTSGCSGGQTVIVTPTTSITDVAGWSITSSAATKILAATAIIFTAGTDTRDYNGGVTSSGTPTVTSGSLALGDSLFFSTQTFSDKNFGVGNKTLNITPGSIVIKNGDVDVTENYTISLVAFTTGTINTRAITFAAGTDYKDYDSLNTSVGIPTVVGGSFGSGDSLYSGTQTFADQNVGLKTLIVTPGSIVIKNGGVDVTANYAISFSASSSGTINARAITVTAATDSKEYDNLNTSVGVPIVISGVLQGTDSITAITQTFDNKNVGTLKTLTPAGVVTDGNGGLNYTLTLAPVSTGIITPTYTVTSISQTSGHTAKIGDHIIVTLTSGGLTTGLTASGTQTINAVTSTFAEVGSGVYTVDYHVAEGNTDILDSVALPVSFTLKQGASNIGTTITTIAFGIAPGVDAHTPTVTTTVSQPHITTADDGNTFDVISTFSEPMDIEIYPTISFSENVLDSGLLTFIAPTLGSWLDLNKIFTQEYTINGLISENFAGVDVTVEGGQDYPAGNVMATTNTFELFDVDTQALPSPRHTSSSGSTPRATNLLALSGECELGNLFSVVTGKLCPNSSTSFIPSLQSPTSCPISIYGSTQELVKEKTRGINAKGVQNAINQLKATTLPLATDGVIGPLSEVGIKNVQKILLVTLDGIWGPKTQQAYVLFIMKQCPAL